MPVGTGDGPVEHPTDPRLVTVAAAVQATAEVRSIAARLRTLGVPVMILRGPPVQRRLLGNDSSYRSADVDLLVRRADRQPAFDFLVGDGWRFSPHNGVLWRLDRAAAFTTRGMTVDLHWGLHAHSVSGRYLRPLERALWEGAIDGPDGCLEPQIEPLLAYLAVHGAASGFHKPESLTLIRAADRLVTDRAAVEALARRAHVWSTVRYALAAAGGAATTPQPPLFDGRARQLASGSGRRARAALSLPALRRFARTMRSRRST